MHARAFTMTILSVSFFAPAHTAPHEGARRVVNTPDSLRITRRAVFNAICSSPNAPALARANSDSIINLCCPPDHPIGGWIDLESRPICCPQSVFASTCRTSSYKSSVKPANVVRCDGPKNIPTVLANSGMKICQALGNAERSETEATVLGEGVEVLYLPGEFPHLPGTRNHTSHDHEDVVNAVEVADTNSTTLSTRRDLITAECFHNYVPTLAHHDSVSTINICCPFIFPQGGWHLNTDPIYCPAGTTKDDCSYADLLHVNADNGKRCLGPGNVPVGKRNSHVSVCKAPSAGGTKREVPTTMKA